MEARTQVLNKGRTRQPGEIGLKDQLISTWQLLSAPGPLLPEKAMLGRPFAAGRKI